jgi:hypothetical protein
MASLQVIFASRGAFQSVTPAFGTELKSVQYHSGSTVCRHPAAQYVNRKSLSAPTEPRYVFVPQLVCQSYHINLLKVWKVIGNLLLPVYRMKTVQPAARGKTAYTWEERCCQVSNESPNSQFMELIFDNIEIVSLRDMKAIFSSQQPT